MRDKVRRGAGLMPLLALAACAHHGDRAETSTAAPAAKADWRSIAMPADRTRLRTWRETWVTALARVTAAGRQRDLAAQGALLQPDGALPDAAPPPGGYRCRVTKLGARKPGLPEFVAFPPFDCRIARDGDSLTFAKLTGSQRPAGLFLPDDGNRLIFLGTMVLGDERMAQPYGRDPDRDMIGIVERIGPQRWRLILPSPRWESLIDVIELVPAAAP